MSGGDRAAVKGYASRGRSRSEPGLGRGRVLAADGGPGHYPSDDSRKRSAEDGSDHIAETDHNPPSQTDHDSTPEATREQPPETAGGQALAERSRQQIESEIEELEQTLDQYETQDQAVIDRYEGLLAERQHKKRRTDPDQETGYRRRLRQLKAWALRLVGLR